MSLSNNYLLFVPMLSLTTLYKYMYEINLGQYSLRILETFDFQVSKVFTT